MHIYPFLDGLYACYFSGRFLEVVNSRTGERVTAYEFGKSESYGARVTAVCELKIKHERMLLVGYEDETANLLCIFNIRTGIMCCSIVFPQSVNLKKKKNKKNLIYTHKKSQIYLLFVGHLHWSYWSVGFARNQLDSASFHWNCCSWN